MSGYMGFVGVTTGNSSIRKVFPLWARELGLPTDQLIGHDVPLGAEPTVYRDLVSRIHQDPAHYGALVTTHKINVYEAAADLFDELDELATTFGEISSISKRGDRLCGAAKDPITVRLALSEFLPDDHFARTGGEALVLGSGGSGSALSHQLGVRKDRPDRITCTARSEVSLDHLRELHQRAGIDQSSIRYVVASDPAESDALVAALPADSLVVNATGLGKDRPGSPLTDEVHFPPGARVWDFNYRGDLGFLRQARNQAASSDLVVEDGWRYFVHGWSQVVAEVFDIPLDQERIDRLSELAQTVR